MSRFVAGLLSGIIATAVVSILMVLEMTFVSEFRLGFIEILMEAFAQLLGMERNLLLGWVVHLVIGIVVGGSLYAIINPQGGNASVSRGLQFGLIIWLLMMTVLMPVAGKGPFGLADGVLPMLWTLVLHLIYGVILAHYYSHMLEPVRVVPRERLEDRQQTQSYLRRYRWRRPLHQR